MAGLSIRQQLWLEQGKLCALCRKPLAVKGSHRHHLRHGDGVEVLVLVHPRCHIKVHQQGIMLSKRHAIG